MGFLIELKKENLWPEGGNIMTESIGNKICMSRQNKGMTQEEFASRLGVTPQAVSKWERGNGLPDVSLLQSICRILEISANTLLDIKEYQVDASENDCKEQEIYRDFIADPVLLEFGEDLIPCVIEGLNTDFLMQKRKSLVRNKGLILPLIRLRDDVDLPKQTYRILVYDQVVNEGSFDTIDSFAFQKMIEQVISECVKHYDQIINKQIVKTMMDQVRIQYSSVVDGLIPEKISYLKVERKLQSVFREKGSLRDLIHIIEELEEEQETTIDF